MASLRAQLTLKLDASSLVQGFLTDVDTPAGALTGIADPTPPESLAAIDADLGGPDLGSLDGRVKELAEGALSLTGALPAAADVIKPVTEAIEAIEALVVRCQVADASRRRARELVPARVTRRRDRVSGDRLPFLIYAIYAAWIYTPWIRGSRPCPPAAEV
jgi:hypothetical protein